MKKLILSLSLFLSFSSFSQAQWVTSGTNVTYSLGNVGIGPATPQSLLHVSGVGTSLNQTSTFDPKSLIIQGNTGSRNALAGAQLEFAIPANTDGTNIWGQARIITVAGTTNNADASGKLILGTRRMMNKLGTTTNWYYGDDLTIDAKGNVGIGFVNPQNKLDVNGTIHTKSVLIDLVGWSDYVLKKDYQLLPLSEVKTYINQNQHLPEIPSEHEMIKKGLDVSEMNKLLMKKVEELTLYLIEKDQQLKAQEKVNRQTEERIQALEERLNTRKKKAN